jgi:hypothetical protein
MSFAASIAKSAKAHEGLLLHGCVFPPRPRLLHTVPVRPRAGAAKNDLWFDQWGKP